MFLCGIQTRPNWEMHVFRWDLCLTYEGLAGQGAQHFGLLSILQPELEPVNLCELTFAIPLRLKIPNASKRSESSTGQARMEKVLQFGPKYQTVWKSLLHSRICAQCIPMLPFSLCRAIQLDRGAGTLYRRRATTVAWCQSPRGEWAARLHFRNERDRRTCRGQENHGSQLSQSSKDSKQM